MQDTVCSFKDLCHLSKRHLKREARKAGTARNQRICQFGANVAQQSSLNILEGKFSHMQPIDFFSHKNLNDSENHKINWWISSTSLLSGGKLNKKQYSTEAAIPDGSDLQAKLTDMEQKLESVARNADDITKLEADLNQYVSSFSKSLNDFANELRKFEEKINNLQENGTAQSANTPESNHQSLVESVVKEIDQREHRKLCLIVQNFPESTEENGVLRKAHDINVFNKLFSNDLNIPVRLVDARRRTTPMRQISDLVIQFESEGDKKKFALKLGELKKLTGTIWPQTRFRAFLTAMQWTVLKQRENYLNDQAASLGLGRPWFIDLMGTIKQRKPGSSK